MNIQINVIELLINISLAASGGIVRRLAEKEKYPKRNIKFSAVIISAGISIFVGVVFYLLCKYMSASPYLTMAVTSVTGFIGSPAVMWVYSRITKTDTKDGGE